VGLHQAVGRVLKLEGAAFSENGCSFQAAEKDSG
jgi:hypothetical protein